MKKYSYKWFVSKSSWIYVIMNIAMGLIFTIWVFLRVEDISQINPKGLYGIWTIFGCLALICLYTGRETNIRLSPIYVDETGIQGNVYSSNEKLFIKNEIIHLGWNEIEKIEYFDSSDIDAVRVNKHSGIRIMSGEKKLVIYDHIKNYSEIDSYIKNNVKSNVLI